MFFEYAIDIAKIARKNGLKNIAVSNGYVNKNPLMEFCRHIDAFNIDLKAFNEGFYKKICSASLAPVLESLKIIKKKKRHLEITNLMIPGLNDNMPEFEKMCIWIKNELGRDVPLHISRFFPMYNMLDRPVTPRETLLRAEKTAKKHLDNVHLGNI